MRPLCLTLCLTVFCLVPAIEHAQPGKATPPATPIPADARQFLAQASKINGLASENLGPWHIKATFQLLDKGAAPHESGSFEAFWKSSSKFKMVYTSPSYSRTVWSNEAGDFATSDPRWPGDVEWMVRRSLFDVVPEPTERRVVDLRWREATIGVKLKCIDSFPIYGSHPLYEVPFYCFDPAVPVIRFSSEVGRYYQATFNNIVSAQGIYVARDVELLHGGEPYFRIHVDTLEPLPESGEDVFRADSGALPVARRTVIDSDLRDVHTTIQVGLPNSTTAIANGPYTKVHIPTSPISTDREIVVQVLVNKKGKVADARVVKGDPFRQAGAVSAARSWEFKPYVVQGEPIEFYTELEFF